MKGITYLIIASIVWSIVSGIIEKRKAAAKKAAARGILSPQSTLPQSPQSPQSPVSVKVQSLRRRKQPVHPAVAVIEPERERVREMKPIAPLHKKECPLSPQELKQKSPAPAKNIAKLLHNRRNTRTAIVLSEILGKPVSQR